MVSRPKVQSQLVLSQCSPAPFRVQCGSARTSRNAHHRHARSCTLTRPPSPIQCRRTTQKIILLDDSFESSSSESVVCYGLSYGHANTLCLLGPCTLAVVSHCAVGSGPASLNAPRCTSFIRSPLCIICECNDLWCFEDGIVHRQFTALAIQDLDCVGSYNHQSQAATAPSTSSIVAFDLGRMTDTNGRGRLKYTSRGMLSLSLCLSGARRRGQHSRESLGSKLRRGRGGALGVDDREDCEELRDEQPHRVFREQLPGTHPAGLCVTASRHGHTILMSRCLNCPPGHSPPPKSERVPARIVCAAVEDPIAVEPFRLELHRVRIHLRVVE